MSKYSRFFLSLLVLDSLLCFLPFPLIQFMAMLFWTFLFVLFGFSFWIKKEERAGSEVPDPQNLR